MVIRIVGFGTVKIYPIGAIVGISSSAVTGIGFTVLALSIITFP